MKTANQTITQAKRIMAALDKTAPDYSARLQRIAEIGRAYLHNIANYYGKPYGLKTWAKYGNNPLSREIYAKH